MKDKKPVFSAENNLYRLRRRTFLRSTAAGTGLLGLSKIGASQEASEFVDILSADPSDYPNVLLNVSVDTAAGRDGRLTEDDFEITENGVRKAIQNFSFTSTTADIVFVFDDTGSMGDEIDDMKAGVQGLTDDIEAAGIDSRYSLVTFKDTIETDLGFTENAAQLKSAVDDLSARGGNDSPEDNFDAIIRALNTDFRPGAQKILIDITDNVSHYRGDGTGFSEYTIDEVATRLEESGVAFIAVAPDRDEPEASKKVLAEMVDGLWIDIQSADFSRILERIKRLVATAYVVEYLTSLPPGRAGDVSVTVSDPNEGTATDSTTADVPSGIGPGEDFLMAKEQKLTLADRITTLAESIDERTMVQEVIEGTDSVAGLQGRIENGTLGGGDGIKAIERMKLAENVTEVTLAGLGSRGPENDRLWSDEDPDTLIGLSPELGENPDLGGRQGYNIVETWVETAASIVVAILAAATAILTLPVSGLTAVGLGGAAAALTSAGINFSDSAGDVLDVFEGVSELDNETNNIKRDIVSQIKSGAIETADEALRLIDELIPEEMLAGVIMNFLERENSTFDLPIADVNNSGVNFEAALNKVNSELNNNASDLSGSQSAAREAAREGVRDIRTGLNSANETLSVFDVPRAISSLLNLSIQSLGSIGALGSGLLASAGSITSAALSAFNFGLDLVEIVTTTYTIFGIRGTHNTAQNMIIQGRSGEL